MRLRHVWLKPKTCFIVVRLLKPAAMNEKKSFLISSQGSNLDLVAIS
jgi:hypothetical protein